MNRVEGEGDPSRGQDEPEGPYCIGSDHWPGLSKLTEEAGEVLQVIGKLIGTGGREEHWDGSNLRERLIEELGDVMAACHFVAEKNGLDIDKLIARAEAKTKLFDQWHAERTRPPEP